MEERIKDLELAVAALKQELDQLKAFEAETIKFIEESLTYSKRTNDTLVKHAETMEQLRSANGKIIRTITELATLIRR
jgi:phage shock protein A